MARVLQYFIRLSHLGWFDEAHTLFVHSPLSTHRYRSYPVMVEFADCLLRQGQYEHLSDHLENMKDERLKVPGSQERQTFDLYKGIADIHRNGSLEDSLRKALEVWGSRSNPLPLTDSNSISCLLTDRKLDEMERFLLELILQIFVAVQSKNSTLL